MPKFNWIFGHLLEARKILHSLPTDVHINVVTAELAKHFPDSNVFIVDLWPFTRTMLVVASPSAAAEVTQALNLPKPQLLHDYFLPLTGGPNLFTMREEEWRPWRTVFNPGFSNSAIVQYIPCIVEEVQIYCEMLRERARAQRMFHLDKMILALTMDIIGHVTL